MEAVFSLGFPVSVKQENGFYLKRDLISRLEKIRGNQIKPDAFRRWRKKADIPLRVRGRYSINHCKRLALIASHLANNGYLNDDALDLKLMMLFEEESQ